MNGFDELPAGYTPVEDKTTIAAEPTTDFMTELPAGYTAIDPDTEEPRKGFMDRVEEKITTRVQRSLETLEDYEAGEFAPGIIGDVRAATQGVGQVVAGGFLDIVGEGVSEALHGFSLLIPDEWEESAKETLVQGWNAIANTSLGEEGLAALEKGVKGYDAWAKNYPQDAKTFESFVNVALVLAPAKARKKAGPLANPVGELSDKTLGATGRALAKSSEKLTTKLKAKFIGNLLEPKQTLAARKAAVPQVKEVPLIPGTNILPRGQVIPDATQQAMAAQVLKVPGLKTNMNIQQSFNVIRDHNTVLAKDLAKKVALERKIIPKNQTVLNMSQNIEKRLANHPVLVETPKSVAAMTKQASKFVHQNNPTPAGLLKARKQFDNWVQDVKGGVDFSSDKRGMLDEAARAIRNSMTQQLDDSLTSVAVKKSLREQELLYKAMDVITPKAADYTNNRYMRIWQNATRALGFQRTAAQEVAFSTGIGQMGAATLMAPVYGVGLMTLGLVKTGKAMVGPTARKAAGTLLKQVDKAIKTSTNPDMIRQLRADRAFLVDIMKQKQEEALDE